MALIGEIRKRLWIVLIPVGLALIGFLFMEAKGSENINGSSTTMGKIDGKKVDYLKFDKQVRLRYNGSNADQYTLKNALWNSLINETIVENEGEKLGLTVSDTEMESLVYGPNFSPVIIQDFPAKGQQNPYGARTPDIEQLNQIRDLEDSEQLNPQYVPFWNEEKNRVKRDRMQTKLVNLVSKSIYTPSWLAKMQHNDRNGIAQLAYVMIPFDEIPNTEVALEDTDYTNYLNENKARYTKDVPQQTLSFVTFDIKPTAKDSADIKSQLVTLNNQFKTIKTSENKTFVESKQGVYSDTYAFKSDLPDNIAANLWSADLGTTYGPYLEGDFYKVAKVIDRMVVPDSVAARHILRSGSPQNPISMQSARDTIMMIKKMIESGEQSFDSLAIKMSQDPGSGALGGDLGAFEQGKMVPEFNNACFFDAKNELKVVTTQFGVHLIEVTKRHTKGNKTGAKVAYIQKSIVPSKETTKGLYGQALRFANDHKTLDAMKTAAKEANLEVTTSEPIDANGFNINGLGTGESTRSMIKWANEAKTGEVSPTIYRYSDRARFYENKYIVAAKASEDKAGLPSVASMKKTIEKLVMNEKKGTMISSQIAGLTGLSAIATKYDVKVDSTSTAFSGLAPDAKVIAEAFKLENGQTSKPVIGTNGVYVVTMINKPAPSEATNLVSLKNQISSQAKNQARSALLPALKKETKIKDQRSDFF